MDVNHEAESLKQRAEAVQWLRRWVPEQAEQYQVFFSEIPEIQNLGKFLA